MLTPEAAVATQGDEALPQGQMLAADRSKVDGQLPYAMRLVILVMAVGGFLELMPSHSSVTGL
jgi:hypothetical protein